jgi:hypothetical protein
MLEVYGSQFVRLNEMGDFLWMIKNPEFDDCLFIFNDSEEHHNTNIKGGGNAIIRPYNKYNTSLPKPRSCGIPTGTRREGGYSHLSEHAKTMIDNSIAEIRDLLHQYEYKRIFYSADKDGKLGTSIFVVGEDVVDYITSCIIDLVNI